MALALCTATGATAQAPFALGFESLDGIGSWTNTSSDPGLTLSLSDDAAEGENSLSVDYDFVADESWGGSVDFNYEPEGGFVDLSDADGITFWYKTVEPVSNTAEVSFAVKLVDASAESGVDNYEARVPVVITDESGEWQQIEIPFSSFALPSWITPNDETFDLDAIASWEMQVVVGTPGVGNTYAGTVLIDGLALYSEAAAMTIADARAAGVGSEVTVTGTVTRSMGDFTYLQDETAGLTIRQPEGDFFDAVADGTIAPGTILTVTGTVSEYRGLFQLNEEDLASYSIDGTTDVPAPQEVALQDLMDNGEDYEAELITVAGLTADATGSFAAATNYDVTQDATLFEEALRVPNESDSAVDGMEIPEGPFRFTGVVGQFTFDEPATNGYQLLAIQESDVVSAPPPPPPGTVLNTNPGFEDSPVGAIEDLTSIEGWVLETDAAITETPDYAIVGDVAHTGDKSLAITVNEAGANSWNIQAVADAIPVVPGESYVLSVWARAETAGATASFTVGNYDFNEYGRLGDQTLSDEWEEFVIEFTVTDQETVIRAPIHFSFAANAGNTIYIDDLEVMQPPPPPGTVLNTNPGFEGSPVGAIEDLTGIEGWVLETGSGITDAPDYAIVDDVTHTGDKAFAVTVNEAGANSWNIQAVADAIPVIPGRTYIFSAWARAATDGGTATFTAGNYDFNEYGRLSSQTLTTEWQEFTFEFTVTDQETVIRAPIHFSFAANAGNTIYLDDVEITPAPGVANEEVVESRIELGPNFPNPFRAMTTIRYTLDVPGEVALSVFNTLGQHVATLVDEPQAVGQHTVEFDASGLASGVYLYRLRVGDAVRVGRMMVVR